MLDPEHLKPSLLSTTNFKNGNTLLASVSLEYARHEKWDNDAIEQVQYIYEEAVTQRQEMDGQMNNPKRANLNVATLVKSRQYRDSANGVRRTALINTASSGQDPLPFNWARYKQIPLEDVFHSGDARLFISDLFQRSVSEYTHR